MSVFLGTELDLGLLDRFDKRISTVVIATLDSKQQPHTAPFNYLVACDAKHLRVAIERNQQTFNNLMANGKISLAVLEEGDLAFSIKGDTRLYREQMLADAGMAIMEIEVAEVRKNNSTAYFVTQGIRIRHKNELVLLASKKIFQELKQG